MEIGKHIIEAAVKNGASLAGIAGVEDLKNSASHTIYSQMGDYTGVGTVKEGDPLAKNLLFNWPDTARSVLVIGLSHPKEKPELDWWDGKGTPGNRILIDVIDRTARQIESGLKVKTHKLHYHVEKGGIFLKDAAVLAGFGCIGKNNLLVTPAFGPRIRLRAMFLDAEITPTGPIAFDPCDDCERFCRKVCHKSAMTHTAPIFRSEAFSGHLPGRDGSYDRLRCNIQMEKDEAHSTNRDNGPITEYCRRCEFVCPAGRKQGK